MIHPRQQLVFVSIAAIAFGLSCLDGLRAQTLTPNIVGPGELLESPPFIGPVTEMSPAEAAEIEQIKQQLQQRDPDARSVGEMLNVLGEGSIPAPNLGTPPFVRPPAEEPQCSEESIREQAARAFENMVSADEPGYKRWGATPMPTIDIAQARLQATHRELDIAVDGPGFLTVLETSSGDFRFTRYGELECREELLHVVVDGVAYPLQPEIMIPADTTEVIVSTKGRVLVRREGSADSQDVGRIQLAVFKAPEHLTRVNGLLFQESDGSGAPHDGFPSATINAETGESFGVIRQGMLEQSNVTDFTHERIQLEHLLRTWDSVRNGTMPSEPPFRPSAPLLR